MFAVFVIAVLIILLIVILKYPAISLPFFLMAGVVKGMLMLRVGFFRVVDFTVLAAVLVLVAMAYNFARRGFPWRHILNIPLGIYLLLAGLLFLCWTYTTAPHYGFQKWSRFATLGFISFLAPIVFCQRLKDMKLILWIVLVVGVIISIGTIVAPHIGVLKEHAGGIYARGTFLEANPLPVAVLIGTASIIAFCLAIMAHTSKSLRIVSLILAPLMALGIIIAKSRGPFFGLLFTWLVAVFICRKGVSKGWLPFIVGAIVISIMIMFMTMPEMVTGRIAKIWRSGYEAQETGRSRIALFIWTIERVPERPFLGHGTGAWALDWSGQDIRAAPHNIVLEVLYEQGLVGAALISLFLLVIFMRWRRAARLVHTYGLDIGVFQIVHIAGLLFFYTFLQAMAAFDINENRLMFFCAGLVVATFNCVRHATEEVYVEDELITSDWQQSEGGGFQDAEVSY